MAQSKTDASPAQTFVNELLEVIGQWRADIDPNPVTIHAKATAETEQRILDKLDEMLRYCGVVE